MKRAHPIKSRSIKYGKPDDENSEWTGGDFKRASRLRDHPEMHAAVKRALRGRPSGTAKKMPVTISLDKDIVAMLRKSGDGWQTRLNDVLRSVMGLLV